MATRGIITFCDGNECIPVYQHWDCYPSVIVDQLEAAKEYAWPLPRFEANDFAAAYVAANKPKGGGDIRITGGSGYLNTDAYVIRFDKALNEFTLNGTPLSQLGKGNN